DTGQHAVTANVSIDNGFNAIIFKFAAKIKHIMLGQLAPAVGGNPAIFGVTPNDNMSRKSAAGILQTPWVFHSGGADNDVLNAEIQIALNGIQITDTAPDLDRNIVSDGPHDGFDHIFVLGLAGNSAVQVNQMQAACALVIPLFRDGNRVFGKNGGVLQVPLA